MVAEAATTCPNCEHHSATVEFLEEERNNKKLLIANVYRCKLCGQLWYQSMER